LWINASAGGTLNDLTDVDVSTTYSPGSNYVKYNSGTNSWATGQVTLGTDTLGEYVSSIQGGSYTSVLSEGGNSWSVSVDLGSTSAIGVVQLSDSTTSTDTSLAATANSVRKASRDTYVRLLMEVS
jgi:hypothetical protein